jgi:hypothetical protein
LKRGRVAGGALPNIRPLVKAVARPGARRLIYNYLELSADERSRIARELGLIEEADESAPEFEQHRLVFSRARQRGLIEKLAEMIGAAKVSS